MSDEGSRELFDDYGYHKAEGLVVDCNYYLSQPQLDGSSLDQRIKLLHDSLGIDTGVTTEQFMKKIRDLYDLISDNDAVCNILNGVYLPVILPAPVPSMPEILMGIAKNYKDTFRGRKFNDSYGGDWSDVSNITIQQREGVVVGFYFPNALQGLSIADGNRMALRLPKRFSLSGLDAMIGTLMYPDVLARDWFVPRLVFAAFRTNKGALFFKAHNNYLELDETDGIKATLGSSASGLFFCE